MGPSVEGVIGERLSFSKHSSTYFSFYLLDLQFGSVKELSSSSSSASAVLHELILEANFFESSSTSAAALPLRSERMTGPKSQRRFLPPPPPPPPAVSTSPATSTPPPPLTKPKTGYWPAVHACPHKDRLMDAERRLAQKRLVELAKMGEVCQQITAEQKAIVVAVHGHCSSSSCANVLACEQLENIEKTTGSGHGEGNSSGRSPANCAPGDKLPTSQLYQVSVSAKVANLKRQRLFEARMAVLKVKSQAKSRRPSTNGGGPVLQSAPVLTKKQRKKLKQKNNKKRKKKQNGNGNCPELENSSSSSSSSFDSSFSSSTSKDEDDEEEDKNNNILKSTITTGSSSSSSSEPQILRKATKSDQKTTTSATKTAATTTTTTPSALQPKNRTAPKRVNTHSEHESLPNVPPQKVLKKNCEKEDKKIDALQPKSAQPFLATPLPSTEPSNEKSVARGRTDPEEIRASTLLLLRQPEKLASRSSSQPVSGFFCPAPGCSCRLFTVFEYYEHLAERHQSKLACPVEGCLQLFEGFSLAAMKAHDRQAHSSGRPISSASMLHRRLEHHLREGQWWCRKGCGYMSTSRAAWRAHEGRRCDGGEGDNDHLLEELRRIECRPVGVDGH